MKSVAILGNNVQTDVPSVIQFLFEVASPAHAQPIAPNRRREAKILEASDRPRGSYAFYCSLQIRDVKRTLGIRSV